MAKTRESINRSFRDLLKSRYLSGFKRTVSRIHGQILKEQEESDALLGKIIDGQTVLSGIFKGMRYPKQLYQTAVLPMLIGSYERELHPIIERLLHKGYREILDIGCAEGYYAVGLALKAGNQATVWAYDIDPWALTACRKTAKENKVEDRMIFKDACTAETLVSFKFTNALIISDCEGYEDKLFTVASVKNLADCDLIVELHDFHIPDIERKLLGLFSGSHNCVIIRTDNYFKHIRRDPKEYGEILKGMNHRSKMEALQEFRPGPMKWLVCQRKGKESS